MAASKTPILFVDDSRANLAALEAIVASVEYEVVSVTSGSDALAEFERRDFAVVLLDLHAPVVDGIETARRMRARAHQQGRRAPVIVVTAMDADRAQVLSAYANGAADFMQKPLEPAVLSAKVAVFAELYRQHELAKRHGEELEKKRKDVEDETQRFRLLVASVKDYAIFILDPKGIVSTWNPGAERIKGYMASDIIGRHFSTFYPREDVAAGKCERELEIATREGRFEEEGWRLRKDGSRLWANVTITALFDQVSGSLIGFAKVTRDLTARRAAEEEAHRFRLLVESVKDYAIFVLDPKGHIATWNAGAARIKGYAASEIIGRHFSTFYPPADVTGGKCDRELEIATSEGRFEEEGWRIRKDGSRFWANVTITALRDRAGVLVGFAKVTRDLTERVRHEETLRHLAAETATLAEKARIQEFQERFIAVLGHDLRNPLAAMDMGTTLLQQRSAQAKDDAGARILDRMKASARRMSRMIEQILDLTRSRLAGGLEMNPETMDLARTISAIADELRTAYPSRGIEVCGPLSVVGTWDPDRLEQVFSNLVGNAVHYGLAERPVRVEVCEKDASVLVTVHNDGPPIPEKLRAELFSPFRRGERDSRTSETAGLGLGLYISREIVLAHGGNVEVSSAPIEGTTFLVTLPRTPNTSSSR